MNHAAHQYLRGKEMSKQATSCSNVVALREKILKTFLMNAL
jgi:hypothetical protein